MEKTLCKITCKSDRKPNKILKTIFKNKVDERFVKSDEYFYNDNLPMTITSETIDRFKPYIFVLGLEDARMICSWLNENNPEISYTLEDHTCYDSIQLREHSIEARYAFQRVFGLNISYFDGTPIFPTAESYFGTALNSLNDRKWCWDLEMGKRPTLVKIDKKDNTERELEKE